MTWSPESKIQYGVVRDNLTGSDTLEMAYDVVSRVEDPVKKRYPAFILNQGSFNPVHTQHLFLMAHAKQHLEEQGFEVVRGLLAITPQKRLIKKGAPQQCGTSTESWLWKWLAR